MSRSVKQDYPPKTNVTFWPEGDIPPKPSIPTIFKMGAVMQVSDEQLFELMGYSDSQYKRKANKIIHLPTQETWAQYYAAVGALRVLKEYEFTEWGGPDYDTEVPEPYPTNTYEYLETHDEWLARCRALRQETA